MIRGRRLGRPPAAAALVLLLTAPLSLQAAPGTDAAPLSLSDRLPAAVQAAQKAVEKVRGVAFRSPVACVLLPEKQLGPVLEAKLTEDLPAPFETYAASLVAVGLIEPVPGLMKRIANLYTRQVVGFYDPAEKKFYVVPERAGSSAPDVSGDLGTDAGRLVEESLLAHELTHALQDQRLDLDRKIKGLRENTDALLALEAMLEGEATVVMAEVLLERTPPESRALLGKDILGEMVSSLSLMGAGAVDGADGVPEFFVKELLFPYTAGSTWVQRKRGAGWAGIEEAYRHPPETTAEILHPDRKASRARLASSDRPTRAQVPAGGRTLYTDSFGEWVLGHMLDLAGAGDAAPEIAATWQDDRILFFERPGNPSPGVGFLWRVRCASAADAARLAAAIAPVYSARPPESRPTIHARGEVVAIDLGMATGRRGPSAAPEARRRAELH